MLTEVHTVKAVIFPVSVWMWELNHKEGWVPKTGCFWTVVLEKTFESPLDCKEIKPVNPKRNEPWIFIGRTYAGAPALWPPDMKSQLIRKDPDAGRDWRQEEKGAAEDEMVGWHHRLNAQRFEQAPGDGGQWSLVCCNPWGLKRVRHDWATEQHVFWVHQSCRQFSVHLERSIHIVSMFSDTCKRKRGEEGVCVCVCLHYLLLGNRSFQTLVV